MSTPSAPTPAPSGAERTVVHPLVDLFQGADDVRLFADLPGVAKDALELTVAAGKLELRATTATLEYRRSFALAEDLDLEAVEAKLEHGVLEVRLPKRAATRARKVPITSG